MGVGWRGTWKALKKEVGFWTRPWMRTNSYFIVAGWLQDEPQTTPISAQSCPSVSPSSCLTGWPSDLLLVQRTQHKWWDDTSVIRPPEAVTSILRADSLAGFGEASCCAGARSCGPHSNSLRDLSPVHSHLSMDWTLPHSHLRWHCSPGWHHHGSFVRSWSRAPS